MSETTLKLGNPCATILVLDPVYVQAYVSEEHVHQLNLGQEAEILLPNGATRTGTLSFVSRRGDLSTRTFRIEIELPNEDYAISSGLSATINLTYNSTHGPQDPCFGDGDE